MDILQIGAKDFKTLFHKKYTIQAGRKGKVINIVFYFGAEHYHHLTGFHKLIDLPNISKSKNKKNLFQSVLNGKIPLEKIEKSSFYDEISDRVLIFSKLKDLVNNLQTKDIVIKFNSDTAKTRINAEILLYNNDVLLFLKSDTSKGENYYVPETFFVRSNHFIDGQEKYTILDFNIESIY